MELGHIGDEETENRCIGVCYIFNAYQTYTVNVEETVVTVSLYLRGKIRPREPSGV